MIDPQSQANKYATQLCTLHTCTKHVVNGHLSLPKPCWFRLNYLVKTLHMHCQNPAGLVLSYPTGARTGAPYPKCQTAFIVSAQLVWLFASSLSSACLRQALILLLVCDCYDNGIRNSEHYSKSFTMMSECKMSH